MNIAAPHLGNLLSFASTLGMDQNKLKHQFLANPDLDLSSVEQGVSEQEFMAILAEMLALSRDSFLGLHYGCFMNLKALGLILTLSKSATSVEQAVLFLKDFLERTFPVFSIELRHNGSESSMVLHCSAQDEIAAQHLADASLCILYRELSVMAGNSFDINICFPGQKLEEYQKLIGKTVISGQRHAITFNRQLLEEALNQHNIVALGELLPQFLLLLDKPSNEELFAHRVRKMVLNMCSPELPKLEKVASQFCLSVRSFQRRLTEEGKSYRTIANEIKRDLAKYLQKNDHITTMEIAHLLGYSEASAYLHAVKKW